MVYNHTDKALVYDPTVRQPGFELLLRTCMVIAEPLPYEHRVVCSQSAEVVLDLFRQVPMW